MNNGVFAGCRLHPGFAPASWLEGLEAPDGVMGFGFACPGMPGRGLATMELQNCSEPCPSYRPVWTAERSAWILCNSDGGGRKVDALLQLYRLFPLAFTEYRGQRQGA